MISGLGAVQVLTSSRTYKDDKDKYKIIVKELRSWLEDELKDCDNYSKYIENKLQELKARSSGKTYIANEIMKNEVAKKCFKDVLNKLNELEGKDGSI